MVVVVVFVGADGAAVEVSRGSPKIHVLHPYVSLYHSTLAYIRPSIYQIVCNQ